MTAAKNMETFARIPADVLEDLKNGSYSAYTLLYEHYYAPIWRFLSKLIRSEEDAKEITQNIFIRLWEKREVVDTNSDIKIFLFQTARFYAYNYFDHKKVREKYLSHLKIYPGQSSSTEELIHYEETTLLVEMALEKMPRQRRKIFEMSRREGKSNEVIAQELLLSKRTVEKHISLAIRDIKEKLGRD